MKYNRQYIDLEYALIQTFLINAQRSILDISYNRDGNNVSIQIVLLEGYSLSDSIIQKMAKTLSAYSVSIKEIHIPKADFNKSKGEWRPAGYEWLSHLLFSKAEA